MRLLLINLSLLLAATGCVTKSQARREAQAAYIAGQKSILDRLAKGITVLGPVQNPNVPWVAGLTLTQAIATANYLNRSEPKAIILSRQGEKAELDVNALANSSMIPLEPGDVIELQQ